MATVRDTRRIHRARCITTILGFLLATSCGGSESNAVAPRVPDPEAGRTAFVVSCAGCHASRDAFDLALFGFAASDIVRRALAHVSQETAEDIAAYVASLRVQPRGRSHHPFQPGTQIVRNDEEFWRAQFGTSGWPANLTPEVLRSIDTRRLDVPLALPLWSSEGDDTDWLPEVPLSSQLLGAQNGVLRSAIDAYYAAPTTANLLSAIARFVRVSTADAAALCYGEANTHSQPRDCFEARRWMSSFAAQHFLRPGADAIPVEVADLFWSTGEAAVTVFFRERAHPRSMVWGWLYLGYSFAPTRFKEDNGYLGQFLQSDEKSWLATFTALRRMVATEDVHNGLPAQRFWDASLATTRAPRGQRANVAEFSYTFLRDWLATGAVLDANQSSQAKEFIAFTDERVSEESAELAQLNRIAALRQDILQRLR
ncbi:MAG: hypothetical protein AB1762_07885 [Gemmatimonadota bacterium]